MVSTQRGSRHLRQYSVPHAPGPDFEGGGGEVFWSFPVVHSCMYFTGREQLPSATKVSTRNAVKI